MDTFHPVKAHIDFLLSVPSVLSCTTIMDFPRSTDEFCSKGQGLLFFQVTFHFIDLPIVLLFFFFLFLEGGGILILYFCADLKNTGKGLGDWQLLRTEPWKTPSQSQALCLASPWPMWEAGREGGYTQPLAACFFLGEVEELGTKGFHTPVFVLALANDNIVLIQGKSIIPFGRIIFSLFKLYSFYDFECKCYLVYKIDVLVSGGGCLFCLIGKIKRGNLLTYQIREHCPLIYLNTLNKLSAQ